VCYSVLQCVAVAVKWHIWGVNQSSCSISKSQWVAACCSVLQCVAVTAKWHIWGFNQSSCWISKFQWVAACCSALQCVAVCSSHSQMAHLGGYTIIVKLNFEISVSCSVTAYCRVLQSVAVIRLRLQHSAIRCNTLLQCVAEWHDLVLFMWQCVAACCSMLQRVAAYCRVLQSQSNGTFGRLINHHV